MQLCRRKSLRDCTVINMSHVLTCSSSFDFMSATEILEEMRQMPEPERRELFERIENEFVEFDDNLTSEQIAELERRAGEALAHPEHGIPWETIRSELFPEKLRRRLK